MIIEDPIAMLEKHPAQATQSISREDAKKTSKSELKPCPFCGFNGEVYQNDLYNKVGCDNCGTEHSEDDWNTRPIEDALQSEIDRLKANLAETQACLLERNIQLDCERKQRRWIPVSKELPELNEKVWVFDLDYQQYSAIYNPYVTDDGRYWISEEQGYTDTITHWMPLPTPPEDEL